MLKIILITGISGSGKTIALRMLEDIGFICIDNFPIKFLNDFIDYAKDNNLTKIAISIDSRSIGELQHLPIFIQKIKTYIRNIKIIFLDAKDDIIIKRYTESRRRHPLTDKIKNNFPAPLEICINAERKLLSDLRNQEYIIDTSNLTPGQLRNYIKSLVNIEDINKLVLTFESFAYKNGIPNDADLVFDVRCLPNPYYNMDLRELNGKDKSVEIWLEKFDIVNNMLNDITYFLSNWLPKYIQETKNYLTVAIGCTGGQHRSVYIVEKLAIIFSQYKPLLIRHRAQEKI
ncbi:RNase adapter protein RapZ [Candidatus Kinetoplastibacterium sorsogonicusi]|uniref:RNase adapter protein RapZ n=1 Tax=Candidatus Kinetoplastidibacterium kentomonadis TaxID=1576550 RepID=A0A3S7JAL8_9PROT|nr:RNase adapter RapZ [Candidatus Kinetoplastibacterium sorsogonicusi]AWD32727.1 RNase adapter protein RapZ [Candidatus Kinetoplastibacterium sorsogonicusi]